MYGSKQTIVLLEIDMSHVSLHVHICLGHCLMLAFHLALIKTSVLEINTQSSLSQATAWRLLSIGESILELLCIVFLIN